MHRRRIVAGLEKGEEGERRRPSRRVAGGEEEGYMGWRVSCSFNPSCLSCEDDG